VDVFGDEKTLLRLEFELRIVKTLAQDSNEEINYLFEVTITVLLSEHIFTKVITVLEVRYRKEKFRIEFGIDHQLRKYIILR